MMEKTKISFIIPFFGQLPPYIDLFLKSCKNNPNYTFMFFTDLKFHQKIPNNVKVINFTLDQFANLTEKKTSILPNITIWMENL